MINVASIQDAEGIYLCNYNNLPIYYKKSEHEYFIRSNEYIVIVAKNESTNLVIGYILGKFKKNNSFEIISFAVDHNYRKQKIGTKLIYFIVELLSKSQVTNIVLNVHVENSVAIQFYFKNKFKILQIKKDYYDNSINYEKSVDAYKMIKYL